MYCDSRTRQVPSITDSEFGAAKLDINSYAGQNPALGDTLNSGRDAFYTLEDFNNGKWHVLKGP
jgi:hypothetical protein